MRPWKQVLADSQSSQRDTDPAPQEGTAPQEGAASRERLATGEFSFWKEAWSLAVLSTESKSFKTGPRR